MKGIEKARFTQLLSTPHHLPPSASQPAGDLERLAGEMTGNGVQPWLTDTRVRPNVQYQTHNNG